MQLLIILGIAFAVGAVTFALQNNAPVTVTFASWHYDGSLAVVLLIAIGMGALIAGLVSTPSVIRGQWAGARLRRQVARLEDERASLEHRVQELELAMPQELASLVPPAEVVPPYVGLRTLAMAQEEKWVR